MCTQMQHTYLKRFKENLECFLHFISWKEQQRKGGGEHKGKEVRREECFESGERGGRASKNFNIKEDFDEWSSRKSANWQEVLLLSV